MPILKTIEKHLEGATRGQSFVWELSLWDFLVKFATPCFWHVSSKIRVWFLHNRCIGLFLKQY